LVRERYAVQAIPTVETNGCYPSQQDYRITIRKGGSYQLELHGHQAEVDDLDSRPHHVVRLDGGNVHVAHLLVNGPLSTSLGNRHGGEEAGDTEGRENELIKGDTLHGRQEGARLGDGEAVLEELEPAELDRSHAEAVGHEARKALKVEGRRKELGVRDQVPLVEGVLAVELVDLYGKGIVSRVRRLPGRILAHGTLAHRCDCLGDGVGDTTEDGVGHHHGKHRSFIVVGVEPAGEPGEDRHLDKEDDGMKKGLEQAFLAVSVAAAADAAA